MNHGNLPPASFRTALEPVGGTNAIVPALSGKDAITSVPIGTDALPCASVAVGTATVSFFSKPTWSFTRTSKL
jgi:hypothetical protein